MQIGLLGPFTADHQRQPFAPNAAKPRQLLALLAVHARQVVPVHALVDELWDQHPPRTAAATVQTYVLQLRRLLARALGDAGAARAALATRYGGYLLDLPPDGLDSAGFERLVRLGRAALDRGEDHAASALLSRALDVWRGGALVDVQRGPALAIEAMRLEEARLTAREARIDADLRLGRHAALLCELTALCAAHPLHEGLHARLILAQYRSGRAWQALETHGRLRTVLVRELGIEPSAPLRRLYGQVLTADPLLDPAV
ncbi:BTAD domain-containing putative transcriptional regulator [Kitasatospora sp. NPDC057198]|uniref:AfsR/SARP family transcriptional regulator n=1 Tax=Kitasatospora sp. NPDC057198 TaxID=3346046 RepID=UPI003625C23F